MTSALSLGRSFVCSCCGRAGGNSPALLRLTVRHNVCACAFILLGLRPNGTQVAEGGSTQTLKRIRDMEDTTNIPNEEQTGRLQQPAVMRSAVWKPTMMLRWVDATKANDSKNAVPFSNDVGWGNPSNVVLQQMWQGDMGEQEWKDVVVGG